MFIYYIIGTNLVSGVSFYFLLTGVGHDILTRKAKRLDFNGTTLNSLLLNILLIFHVLGGAFSHIILIWDVAFSQENSY